MAFIQLNQKTTKDIIDKKQKSSLIVGYSVSSFLVFFKDQTYQHINRIDRSLITTGKLNFVANKSLKCSKAGRIVLLGSDEHNHCYCAVLDVENQYSLVIREISNLLPQLTTQYHFYQPEHPINSQQYYLISIQKNIENGITIAVFDFANNNWCQQMLALNSRFLQCSFVNTSIHDYKFQIQGQTQCHTFALVNIGQRYDSINYSKMKFYHQSSSDGVIMKLKFIITRQLKLKQHFIFLGASQLSENVLYLAGNSKIQNLQTQTSFVVPAFAKINTDLVDNDTPQQVAVRTTTFNHSIELTSNMQFIRQFIGVYEANLFFLFLKNKKMTIVKFNLECEEQLLQFQKMKGLKLQLSASRDCFYSYELHCQQFFERIKTVPSVINFQLVKISGKHSQYKKLIQTAFPKLSHYFQQQVLTLL